MTKQKTTRKFFFGGLSLLPGTGLLMGLIVAIEKMDVVYGLSIFMLSVMMYTAMFLCVIPFYNIGVLLDLPNFFDHTMLSWEITSSIHTELIYFVGFIVCLTITIISNILALYLMSLFLVGGYKPVIKQINEWRS